MSVHTTTGASAAWAAWAAQQQAQQTQAAGSGGIFAVPGEPNGSTPAASAATATQTPATGQGLLQYLLGGSASGANGGTSAASEGEDAADELLAASQPNSQGLIAQALESYAAPGSLPGLADAALPSTNLLA